MEDSPDPQSLPGSASCYRIDQAESTPGRRRSDSAARRAFLPAASSRRTRRPRAGAASPSGSGSRSRARTSSSRCTSSRRRRGRPRRASSRPAPRIGGALCDGRRATTRGDWAPPSPRPPRLKWPNDLMFGDRKAAGILCEAGRPGIRGHRPQLQSARLPARARGEGDEPRDRAGAAKSAAGRSSRFFLGRLGRLARPRRGGRGRRSPVEKRDSPPVSCRAPAARHPSRAGDESLNGDARGHRRGGSLIFRERGKRRRRLRCGDSGGS